MSAEPTPLWARLYALVWLIFLETIVFAVSGHGAVPFWVHAALGVAVLVFAASNARALAATGAPARTRRVSRVIANFAGAQLVLGIALRLGVDIELGLTPLGVAGAVHLVIALAMLAQASSVATGYDMWEEREFEAAEPAMQGTAPAAPASQAG